MEKTEVMELIGDRIAAAKFKIDQTKLAKENKKLSTQLKFTIIAAVAGIIIATALHLSTINTLRLTIAENQRLKASQPTTTKIRFAPFEVVNSIDDCRGMIIQLNGQTECQSI